MVRIPPWTYEELVLAVELIDRRGWVGANSHTPEVVELSGVLRTANFPDVDVIDDSFRSVNSVAMKLSNLIGANPSVDGGLRGGPSEARIVAEFLENPDVMRSFAESLRVAAGVMRVPGEREIVPLDEEESRAVEEGGPSYVLTLRRERSGPLRRRKLQEVERAGGEILCEVCGFDFYKTYGELGHSYIEVHHRTPLHISGQTESSLEDLALLCANCHRMIHRRQWMKVEDLAALVHRVRSDKP
jgi:5-methylcytosine-specific restriction protein A